MNITRTKGTLAFTLTILTSLMGTEVFADIKSVPATACWLLENDVNNEYQDGRYPDMEKYADYGFGGDLKPNNSITELNESGASFICPIVSEKLDWEPNIWFVNFDIDYTKREAGGPFELRASDDLAPATSPDLVTTAYPCFDGDVLLLCGEYGSNRVPYLGTSRGYLPSLISSYRLGTGDRLYVYSWNGG